MTPEEINLIQHDFEQIAPQSERIATAFYQRLFAINPVLQLLFPNDLTEQKKKLMTTLGLAVKSLDEPEKLVPVLENLGRRHALYGVRDEHYDAVGAALLQTLGEKLGAEFSARSGAAWTKMYGFVAATMKRAAGELARAGAPTGNVSENVKQSEIATAPLLAANTTAQENVSPVVNGTKTILAAIFCFLAFGLFAASADAATFVVSNVNDSGAGSLRQAILSVNAAPNEAHVINFNIGTGLRTINLTSALPTVNTNRDVTLDGTTQGGFANVPLIELNGAGAGGSAHGLNFSFTSSSTGAVTIKSLIINRFSGSGIRASGVRALNVYGCYIGTDANGSTDLGNALSGIYLSPGGNAAVSNIGGSGANQRNVIAGNNGDGVYVYGLHQADVKIVNNYIGTNASAVIDLGNSGNGIVVWDFSNSSKVTIGGAQTAERNVISGNNKNGILIGLNESVAVLGNYIGLGANGTTALGNTEDGINYSLDGETDNNSVTIGGANGAGNTIAANGSDGIEIGYYDALGLGTVTPLVVGNRIGTDANGTGDRGNAQHGILVTGYAAPIIGRENAGEGNVVSGNGGSGIYYSGGSGLAEATIVANRIGVSALGAPLANTGAGITLIGTYGLKIGKENVAAAANIISGNGSHGIHIGGGSSGFKIVNNLIGTNTLNQAIPNGGSGVFLTDGAKTGQIGGSAAGSGNTIANNLGDGIGVKANPNYPSVPTDNSFIANSIYANGNLGIDLSDDGISLNDPDDADAGVNEMQNYPEIAGASPAQINGTLDAAPNRTFRVDFYRVDICDAGAHGEGRYHVGSTSATTDANGNASFLVNNLTLATGQVVTATATATFNGQANVLLSTSEFSPCRTVSQPPGNLSLSAANYTVNEGSATATVTVNRTNGSNGVIAVDYATQNGTATAGQDYAATSGTLTFQSGESSKTFNVAITDDQSDEPAETLNIQLSNPSGGAALVSPSSAVLTINDNDGVPQVSGSAVSSNEGNEGTTSFIFNVVLSQPSGFPVAVNYQTADGTANASVDFTATSGTLNFAPGETSKQVTVSVKGDTTPEIDETFVLNLSNPSNATVGSAGAGQILDDDNAGKLQFGAASFNVSEGAPVAAITVTRTNGTAGTVSVNYATQNGTATAGADYQAATGTLILTNGQQSATFNVPVLADAAGEVDETVFLTLSNANGGAALGTPASAILTIADDDGGVPSSVSIGGRITKNNLPLAGVQITLAGSQAATAATDANGNYAFANLPAGGNYLVTATLAGHNFEPGSCSFSNLTSDQLNADFTATTGAPARKLRVAAADTIPNSAVVVPVELVAQGNENSVGFSLNYDPNLLYGAQIALGADAANGSLVFNDAQAGRLGIVVALPSGQTFAAGTRRVVNISFQTAPTTLYSTPLEFVNQPVAGEVADADANTLPAAFENGLVTFAHGFEADVAPRPTGSGNGSVTVADFTQIGKFVAGTAAADQLNEFQRADSSPRGTKGNGALTVSDYTQAGRYAAALDTVQTAGGPTEALSLLELNYLFDRQNNFVLEKNGNLAGTRTIRLVGAQASPGGQVTVAVELDAQGDENAVGFTLNYEAAKFSNPVVVLGTGAAGATLIPNTNLTGKVGIVLGMPAGQTFSAGTRQLITITLNVANNAAGGPSPVAFSDAPVFREVVNINADVLAAGFADGAIQILAPTAASATIGGQVLDNSGRAIRNAFVSLTAPDGTTRSARTNPFGYYRFNDVEIGETYTLSVSGKGFVFNPSTHLLTVLEDRADINFTAEN